MAAESLQDNEQPQRGDQNTTAETNDVEKQQDDANPPLDKVNTNDIEYPGPKQLAGIMVALFLAVFLTALVRLSQQNAPHRSLLLTEVLFSITGPNNHIDRHSQNNRRLPLNQRHRLVWQCLSPHHLLFSAPHGSHLHFLHTEIRVSRHYPSVRNRVGDLWCRT